MTELINGKRIGDEKTITADTIRATGIANNLTEAQIAKAIEAILQAQQELEKESK